MVWFGLVYDCQYLVLVCDYFGDAFIKFVCSAWGMAVV